MMMDTAGRALAAALLAVALTAAAPAARVQVGGPYYRLETTAARYNLGTGAFSSEAPVHIVRNGLDLVADRAEGNTKDGTAIMRGHVVVRDAGGAASVQGKGAEAATLTCDELDVDAKADTYKATGNAHYESATRKADADTMNLDRKHEKLHMEGSVAIVDGVTTAHADSVDADLKSGETITSGAPATVLQASPGPAPEASPPRKTRGRISALDRPVFRP